MTDFTPDSRRAELDALDAPPQAQGGAASGEQAPAQEQERPETPAWAKPMQAYRKAAQEQATEKAMTWEWSHQAKQRADQAEAELAKHRENLESPDANQPPEALKAAHDAALERHEQAQAFSGAVGQYEAARLARNLDQSVPGDTGAVTDDGFDTNAAMKMGDEPSPWSWVPTKLTSEALKNSGTAMEGVGRAIEGRGQAGQKWLDRQQSVWDRIDAGDKVSPKEDVLHYAQEDEAGRAQMRQQFSSRAVSGALQSAGEAVRTTTVFGKTLSEHGQSFVVPPEVEQQYPILINTAGKVGGAVPYLFLGALATMTGGVGAGTFVGAAAAGAASYEETFKAAVAKGVPEAQAHNIAAISGMGNAMLMTLPVSHWMGGLPAMFQGTMAREAAGLATHGLTFALTMDAMKALDNAIAQSSYDPERKLSEGVSVVALAHGDWKGIQGGLEDILAGALLPIPGMLIQRAKASGAGKGAAPKAADDVAAAKTTAEPPTLDDPAKQQEPEKIAASAMKLRDGSLVTAPNHTLAMQKMADERGIDYEDTLKLLDDPSGGFITTTGRYVDRAEAAKIAAQAEQVQGFSLPKVKGKDQLSAQDKIAYAVDPAQEQALREELDLEQSHLAQLSTIRTPEAEEKRAAVQERIAEIEGQLPKPEEGNRQSAVGNREESETGPVAVGDSVQWTSAGADQFKEPATVNALSPDGKWAFVEGSNTGIPVGELTKAKTDPAYALRARLRDRLAEADKDHPIADDAHLDQIVEQNLDKTSAEIDDLLRAKGAMKGLLEDEDYRYIARRMAAGEDVEHAYDRWYAEKVAELGETEGADAGAQGAAGAARGTRPAGTAAEAADHAAAGSRGGSAAVPGLGAERAGSAREAAAEQSGRAGAGVREGQAGASPAGRADAASGASAERLTKQKEAFHDILRNGEPRADWWHRMPRELAPTPAERDLILQHADDAGVLRRSLIDPAHPEKGWMYRRNPAAFPDAGIKVVSDAVRLDRTMRQRERDTGRMVSETVRRMAAELEAAKGDLIKIEAVRKAMAEDKTLKAEDARDAQAIGAGEKAFQDNARTWFRSLIGNRAVEPSDWSRRAAQNRISPSLLAQMSKEALAQGLVLKDAKGRLIRTPLAFVLPNFSPLLGDYVPRQPADAVRQRLEVVNAAEKSSLAERLTDPAPKGKRESKAAKAARIAEGEKAADRVRSWAEKIEGALGKPHFDDLLGWDEASKKFTGALAAATAVRGRPPNRLDFATPLKRDEILQLARLSGLTKITTKTTLADALNRIKQRHDDLAKHVDGVEMAAFAEQGHEQRRAFDSLGFYSNALEQAKSLKQAKGTPEQMLAMLKTAGVKDAEIKATKLDQFLARETGSPAEAAKRPSSSARDVYADLAPAGWSAQAKLKNGKSAAIVRDGPNFDVSVGGKPAGNFRVGPSNDAKDALSVVSARTFEGYRRQGVATAVYNEIARLAAEKGLRLVPDSNQKQAGAAFWAARSPAEEGRSAAAKPKSVTRDQIVKYLEQNRVEVRESVYQRADTQEALDAASQLHFGQPFAELDPRNQRSIRNEVTEDVTKNAAKWSQYSLDPSNPTYRETVIHLPDHGEADKIAFQNIMEEMRAKYGNGYLTEMSPEENARYDAIAAKRSGIDPNFRQGHFSEPNVIAHARTSIQKDAQGKPVFLVDELQSDWGQKLRDGGARDEGKIADIKTNLADAHERYNALMSDADAVELVTAAGFDIPGGTHEGAQSVRANFIAQKVNEIAANARFAPEMRETASGIRLQAQRSASEISRFSAELRTAESATPGHPLVNTTDQWTTTAFRRLIRQAVEAGADSIALSTGDVQNNRPGISRVKKAQALRYNPRTERLLYATPDVSRAGQLLYHEFDQLPADKLANELGKDLAEKLLASPLKEVDRNGSSAKYHEVTGLGSVEIGGHGMRATYDAIYPRMLSKLLSKMDPSVKGWESKTLQSSMDGRTFGQKRTPNEHAIAELEDRIDDALDSGDRETVKELREELARLHESRDNPILFHTFPLTDRIKASVLSEGMPLFSFSSRIGDTVERLADRIKAKYKALGYPGEAATTEETTWLSGRFRNHTTGKDEAHDTLYVGAGGGTRIGDVVPDGATFMAIPVQTMRAGTTDIRHFPTREAARAFVEQSWAKWHAENPFHLENATGVRSVRELPQTFDDRIDQFGNQRPPTAANTDEPNRPDLKVIEGGQRSLAERESAARKVMESPAWKAAAEKPVDASRDTSKQEGYGSPEWLANRKYLVRETGSREDTAERPSSSEQVLAPGAKEPPVPADHIRLYRVETTKKVEAPEWVQQSEDFQRAKAARGRWFTDDPAALDFYKKDIGPDHRVIYRDMPKAEAETQRVSNLPKKEGGKGAAENPAAFSLDAAHEFFLQPASEAAASTLRLVEVGDHGNLLDIMRGDQKIGDIAYTLGDKEVFIDWIGPTEGAAQGAQLQLSVGDARAIQAEFRKLHPGVTRFEGMRATGAKSASGDRLQSIPTSGAEGLPTNDARGSVSRPKGREIIGFHNAVDHLAKAATDAVPGGVAKDKKAYILIGYPGAGKSTIGEAISKTYKAARVVGDDNKAIIPEYEGGKNNGGVKAESDRLAAATGAKLASEGTNLVLETSGKPSSVETRAADLKALGYTVSLVHIDVPKAVAMERAVERFKQDGRPVPIDNYDAVTPGDAYAKVQRDGTVDETARITQDEAQGGWRLAEASPGLEGIRAPLEQIPGRELGAGRRSGDASLEPGAPRGRAQDGRLNEGTEGSLYRFLDRPYTEAARRALPEWAPRFEADLRRMFGDAVGIRVADRLFTAGTAHPVVQGPVRAEMRGSMDPKKWLIAVALRDTSYSAALQTAVHEGAHYKRQRGSHIADQMSDRDATSAQTNAILKQYGLWNDAEWTVLVDRANKIGMADRIAEQKVGDKNMLDFYREHYTEQEKLLHPYATEGERKLRVDEAINGELVAHMAEDFVAGRGTFGAKVDGLLARIAKFFEAMRNALHGLGFRTADDVLEKAFGDSARKPVDGGERIEPTFGMAPEMMAIAGPKAKNAPISSMNLAESMERKGRDADHIFKQTGWFRGPDQMWRFEIDDSPAKLKNLDTHLKKPSAGLIGALMGKKPAGMPAWYKGNVRAATNVKLPDLLHHPKLFEAYPFLNQMRVNVIVGKGVPDSREGGALVFREEGGKLIYSPIQIRAKDQAGVLPTLVHELQHYFQIKEGFATGSHTSQREGDFTVKPLAYGSKTDKEGGPIGEGQESFSPTTIAASQPSVAYSGRNDPDWRNQIAGLSRAEQVALVIADVYDALEQGPYKGVKGQDLIHFSPHVLDYVNGNKSVPKARGYSDISSPRYVRETLLPYLQADLMSLLRVKTEDYLTSVGEKEANLVMDRLGYTPEQRRSTLPQFGDSKHPTKLVTRDFRKAADAVLDSAKRTEAIQKRWEEPVDLDHGVVATRYAEDYIGFEHPSTEGMRMDLRAYLDPASSRAVLVLDPEAIGDAGSKTAQPLTDKARSEVADAAEKHLRSLNLMPTADVRLMPDVGNEYLKHDLSDAEIAFWRARDPLFMADDPRSYKDELQKIAEEKYGKGTEVVVKNGQAFADVEHALRKSMTAQLVATIKQQREGKATGRDVDALATPLAKMELEAGRGEHLRPLDYSLPTEIPVPADLASAGLDPELWKIRQGEHEAGAEHDFDQNNPEHIAAREIHVAKDDLSRGPVKDAEGRIYHSDAASVAVDRLKKIEAMYANSPHDNLHPLADKYKQAASLIEDDARLPGIRKVGDSYRVAADSDSYRYPSGGPPSSPEMASFSSWMGDRIKNRFLGRETGAGADAGGRPSASGEGSSTAAPDVAPVAPHERWENRREALIAKSKAEGRWPYWGDDDPTAALLLLKREEARAAWTAVVEPIMYPNGYKAMERWQAEAKAIQDHPELAHLGLAEQAAQLALKEHENRRPLTPGELMWEGLDRAPGLPPPSSGQLMNTYGREKFMVAGHPDLGKNSKALPSGDTAGTEHINALRQIARQITSEVAGPDGLPTADETGSVSRPNSSPNLDLSPEARKARAEAMGFDTSRILYHTTDADHFDAFDMKHYGTGGGDLGSSLGRGVYLGPYPSGIYGKNAREVYSRTKKPFMWDDRDPHLEDKVREIFPQFDPHGDLGVIESQRDAWTDALKQHGYDAVEWIGRDGKLAEMVVLDPKNLRDVDAAFDPSQESSPLLMAAFKSSTPSQNRSLDQALSQAADALGIMETVGEPKLAKKGKGKTDPIRERVLTIANEGGRSLLNTLGEDLTNLAQQHELEIAKYALPGMPDPIGDGFASYFRDYVARPEDAKAQAPDFTTAFNDFLDAHNPHLLESLERLQQASVDRRDARVARLGGSGGGSGGGLPPMPAPPGQGPGGPPGPGPALRLAQKLPLADAVRATWGGYVRNFQPELFSDKAFQAEPGFRAYKSASAQEKDVIVHQGEEHWQTWNKVDEANQFGYMRALELGQQQPTAELRNEAFRHRRMLDRAFREEALYGSKAQYIEEYFAHQWKPKKNANGQTIQQFLQAKTAVLGPNWFQKAREFNLIDEGIAAGFELRSTNPEELVQQRLMAGADMRQRMELLQQMEKMGLARRMAPKEEEAARSGIGGNGGPPLTEIEAAQLPNAGWIEIKAPNMDKWMLSPDIQPLWKNAVEAKGLWSAENAAGSIFRKWMAFKNVYVPIKLSLSAFHPLHVMHIQMADGLANGWTHLRRGGDAMGAMKSALGGWNPIGGAVGGAIGSLAGPPGILFGSYAGGLVGASLRKRSGLDARAAWLKPENERDAYENELVGRMKEGGFVPQLSEQLKINASRTLQEAMAKGQYLRAIPRGLRRGIEKIQGPIFEKWIPHLKAASYLNATAMLLQRRPDLLSNDVQRKIAFSAIAKSVDNRFGEMFYGNLFWNRVVKDAGIASFLSLGWNLGGLREFGGGAMESVTRRFKGTESRETARAATNKAQFALYYIATAAMGLGAMSWMLTGETPQGDDFTFPRVGGLNPDGSPRRITNMTYLREGPMFMKHVQSANSYPWGAGDMLMNKMMFAPFLEMARNRDYWGYEIMSEDAPLYKQAYQFMSHLAADQANPITIAGAKRAAELSGKPFSIGKNASWYDPSTYDWKGLGESATAKGVGLSMLGFGPAPGYVEKKPYENLISHYYDKYVAPLTKPEERREIDAEKRYVRSQVALANQRGDAAAAAAAKQHGAAAGLRARDTRTFTSPFSVFQFSKLPPNAQADVLAHIPQDTPAEKTIYNTYRIKADPKVKFATPIH